MFETFREFIRHLATDDEARRSDPAEDVRVAAAALLFHVVDVDGIVTETERDRLQQALAQEFGLPPEEVERIAEAGRRADQESVDLYHFTSVLKSRLGEEKRIRFVELLWEVTYADGEVHELEDNLIWRISELLGVSTRDRMLMKREAATRDGAADEA